MSRISLAEIAHQRLASCLQPGDAVIDATLGNGHDAWFLAQSIGPSGHLFGFDVQPAALANSRQRLETLNQLPVISLFLNSHAEMQAQIPAVYQGRIKAIMFNLGYLPGADKSLITQTDSTLQALAAASQLLADGGMLTVMVYPGHAGGDQEAAQVAAWAEQLERQRFSVEQICSQSDKASAPRLFVMAKLGDLL